MKLKKALFITHEGIGNSIFRSQVMEHCESMLSYGYDFDILTYNTFKKTWKTSLTNYKNYESSFKIKLILKKAMWIYLPFSLLINLFILAIDIYELKKNTNYSFIHARADYTAFLAIILKPFHGLNVVWDCRGDSIDELKFNSQKFNFFIRLAIRILILPKLILFKKINRRFADKIIFVSNALQTTILDSINLTKSYVIPCPVPSKYFYFDNDLRINTRKILNIKENEFLYIYSGSMIGYQSMSDFLDFFQSIISKPYNKLIIATMDIEKAKIIFKKLDLDKILFTFVKYEEMNDLFCASDFGVMIRSKRQLNHVASPTKFGEYCLSGLKVIHNNTIDQVSEITNFLNNGLLLSSPIGDKLSLKDREAISIKAKKIYSRNFLNQKYYEFY
tara:strand:+ start:4351 stop:5520 length:1170 start_codon:yes stop_codon:yes gene_type:complete